MKSLKPFPALASILACTLFPNLTAAADLEHARDGSGVYGYRDTPKLAWCQWLVHDPDRPG